MLRLVIQGERTGLTLFSCHNPVLYWEFPWKLFSNTKLFGALFMDLPTSCLVGPLHAFSVMQKFRFSLRLC